LHRVEIDFTADSQGRLDKQARQWTLILGENGLGKSTILRSIALVTAGSDALADLLGDPDSWINLKAEFGLIEAEIATADGKARNLSLKIRRGAGVSGVLKDNEAGLGELDAALSHSARNYFVVGYGVSRHLPRGPTPAISASHGRRTQRAVSVATLFDPDAVLNPLETWAMDLHYRRGPRALELIRDTINSTLPHIKFGRVDKKRRQLLFKTPDGLVPLSALSDGYQNVAGWLGDLLHSVTETFSNLARPLETRGLLLIDEIDLHLHPAWQRQLRRFLSHRLPKFQIVGTTHSILTAQQSEIGELHYLERGARSPILRTFGGDPSKLPLIELMTSPLFGLNTVDSLDVERKKSEYRALRTAKPGRSATAKHARIVRMKNLRQELRDIPNPMQPTSQERRLDAVLQSIQKKLLKSKVKNKSKASRRKSSS